MDFWNFYVFYMVMYIILVVNWVVKNEFCNFKKLMDYVVKMVVSYDNF